MHSGRNRIFVLLWRALARRLGGVWIRVFVIWHPMTHTIIASFVWAKSTQAMSLRGNLHALWVFSMRKSSALVCPSFWMKEGQPSACRDSGPTAAEARRRMKLAVGSGRWVREGLPPFCARRPRTRVSCWIVMMRSFTSSDSAASALLGYTPDEQEMAEGEEVETEPSQIACPAYEELLEVMERTTARLDLPWERTKMAAPQGRLDERYLSCHKRSIRRSRRNGKSHFPLASIGSSIPVLRTLKGCVKAAMRRYPLLKRR